MLRTLFSSIPLWSKAFRVLILTSILMIMGVSHTMTSHARITALRNSKKSITPSIITPSNTRQLSTKPQLVETPQKTPAVVSTSRITGGQVGKVIAKSVGEKNPKNLKELKNAADRAFADLRISMGNDAGKGIVLSPETQTLLHYFNRLDSVRNGLELESIFKSAARLTVPQAEVLAKKVINNLSGPNADLTALRKAMAHIHNAAQISQKNDAVRGITTSKKTHALDTIFGNLFTIEQGIVYKLKHSSAATLTIKDAQQLVQKVFENPYDAATLRHAIDEIFAALQIIKGENALRGIYKSPEADTLFDIFSRLQDIQNGLTGKLSHRSAATLTISEAQQRAQKLLDNPNDVHALKKTMEEFFAALQIARYNDVMNNITRSQETTIFSKLFGDIYTVLTSRIYALEKNNVETAKKIILPSVEKNSIVTMQDARKKIRDATFEATTADISNPMTVSKLEKLSQEAENGHISAKELEYKLNQIAGPNSWMDSFFTALGISGLVGTAAYLAWDNSTENPGQPKISEKLPEKAQSLSMSLNDAEELVEKVVKQPNNLKNIEKTLEKLSAAYKISSANDAVNGIRQSPETDKLFNLYFKVVLIERGIEVKIKDTTAATLTLKGAEELTRKALENSNDTSGLQKTRDILANALIISQGNDAAKGIKESPETKKIFELYTKLTKVNKV